MVRCTERLIEKLEDQEEEEISINAYLSRFTMDTIWNCAFGLDIDLQNDIDNLYLYHSDRVFELAKLVNSSPLVVGKDGYILNTIFDSFFAYAQHLIFKVFRKVSVKVRLKKHCL